MARQLRVLFAGAIYHAMTRGVDRRRIFVDDEDYQLYTRLLATAVADFGWNLLAYCLMPNHVHLLIETPEPNFSAGMHWLHTIYRQRLQRATRPVAARLCRRAKDWSWGSHSLVAGPGAPKWLAHERLEDLLESATGVRCYDRLIATHENGSY
jgi:REP element-mobilizing transposase RayT